MNQKLGARLISKMKFAVETAGNGQIAVDMILKNRERYGLILMDCQVRRALTVCARSDSDRYVTTIPTDAGHGRVRSDSAHQTCRTYGNFRWQTGCTRTHCQRQRGLPNKLSPSRSGPLFGKASGYEAASSVCDKVYADVRTRFLGRKAFGL